MQKIKLALKVFNSKSHGEKILVKVGNESIPDISREKQLDRKTNFRLYVTKAF